MTRVVKNHTLKFLWSIFKNFCYGKIKLLQNYISWKSHLININIYIYIYMYTIYIYKKKRKINILVSFKINYIPYKIYKYFIFKICFEFGL